MQDSFRELINRAAGLGKKTVIPMCGRNDLKVIAEASRLGIISPVFIETRNAGKALPRDIRYELVSAHSEENALAAAIDMTRSGSADILMQGGADAGRFLSAALDPKTGINARRRASHACLFHFPGRPTPVLITDTFIHEHPTLHDKQAIIENAVTLWRAIGMGRPKISALAILEYVNPKIHSTLDSAILSKMAERGQFGDASIEGPLDIDCAISKTAAERKGVKSAVAGDTDIYLVHDVESGYLFAEHLVFIGGLPCCGLVLGTSRPAIINLPFMCDEGLLASIALSAMSTEAGVAG